MGSHVDRRWVAGGAAAGSPDGTLRAACSAVHRLFQSFLESHTLTQPSWFERANPLSLQRLRSARQVDLESPGGARSAISILGGALVEGAAQVQGSHVPRRLRRPHCAGQLLVRAEGPP